MTELDKYPLNTFSEETQKEIQVLINNAVKKNLDIFIKNLDIAIAQCHGGGNGRRLLMQLKEDLK